MTPGDEGTSNHHPWQCPDNWDHVGSALVDDVASALATRTAPTSAVMECSHGDPPRLLVVRSDWGVDTKTRLTTAFSLCDGPSEGDSTWTRITFVRRWDDALGEADGRSTGSRPKHWRVEAGQLPQSTVDGLTEWSKVLDMPSEHFVPSSIIRTTTAVTTTVVVFDRSTTQQTWGQWCVDVPRALPRLTGHLLLRDPATYLESTSPAELDGRDP